MTSLTLRAGLLAMIVLVFPAALGAQARPAAARVPRANQATTTRDEARAMMTELQGISQRLQAAHSRAMQDPQLSSTQATLMRDIKTAMERQDPQLPQLAERVRVLEAEARAAQGRNDAARVQTLTREFATIRQRFMRAQQSVLQQPAIAQRARAFDARLHARLIQVEPQTDQLLARSKQLQERIRQAVNSARPPAAAPRRTP
ncbi:MAG TPA: hypothetical protein VE913_02030 [Longimicrobium sp.]|nr:hypothetical protein [Longimicrobium sp.]